MKRGARLKAVFSGFSTWEKAISILAGNLQLYWNILMNVKLWSFQLTCFVIVIVGKLSKQIWITYSSFYLFLSWKYQSLISEIYLLEGMRFRSSIAHFLGSTLFSFKYCSPFHLRMVRTYFHSSIPHLEWFIQDGEFSWTVNSCVHFLMVITNGANAGGAQRCVLPVSFPVDLLIWQ